MPYTSVVLLKTGLGLEIVLKTEISKSWSFSDLCTFLLRLLTLLGPSLLAPVTVKVLWIWSCVHKECLQFSVVLLTVQV